MSIPRYGIWYKDSTTNKEIVAGITTTWPNAKSMAENLYAIRRNIDNTRDVSTGIFLFEPDKIYTSSVPKRWQVMPLLTSNT